MDRMSLSREVQVQRKKGRREGKKGRRDSSSGVPMKKDVETEQRSAQASDASLLWQHRISGLRGNG